MKAVAGNTSNPSGTVRGKWLFLAAFSFACLLFWWLPSLLFRLVIHMADPVEDGTIVISVCALLLFSAGFLLPTRSRSPLVIPEPLADACEAFAWKATLITALPAFLLAAEFWHSRSGVDYGKGEGIPGMYQAVLYTDMFLGFLYLGLANPEKRGWRPLIIACALITLPRLIVSLHWGRFFVTQAAVPILFIAVARGWIQFSLKRMLQFALVAAALIFVPALTRGDDLAGRQELVRFFASGSTLRLFQDNLHLNLDGRCPPLLVSMTAKIIPYHAMGVCVIDLWGTKNLPATLDRLLAYNEPGSEALLVGPGSNFLLELYLSGGLAGVMAGSALFGVCCRHFIAGIGKRSLFAGIWAECLTRALLAPRSNLGYVFERIPTLFVATLFVVALVWTARLLRTGGAAVEQKASTA
ncbi:MAG: hypothetical protein KGM96_05800 [Acidobacteriota bacterium]|nr:hypothetical protein [Acidobacteriota bacterium]